MMRYTAGLMVLLTGLPAWAGQAQVDELLARPTPPPGVVFEIVSDEEDYLRETLPRVQEWIARLRARFPGLGIAVVSHGDEELALTAQAQGRYAGVHQAVQDLVAEGVPVHVCGTYAGWQGVSPEAFPDYVDVVSQGPSQLRDYESFGYVRILVD